jgi:histone H3/H4
MDSTIQDFWRKCSTCKKPIALGARYYVCSVSTCNGLRTGYVFCSMQCFETHLPGARHKDAGAIEKIAPNTPAVESAINEKAVESATARPPARIIIKSTSPGALNSSSTTSAASAIPKETLIIASRLKEYIQARSEFNTSASVMEVLSEQVRILCDRAIENARADGRKTVLDRDFDFLKNSRGGF